MSKKGGGGGGSSTEYVQSPEARQAMSLMMPAIERIGLAGQYGGYVPEGMTATPMASYGSGKTGFGGGSPGQGSAWSAFGLQPPQTTSTTNQPITPGLLWGPGNYSVPDITSMMPTTQTMSSISPDVKAAVMAPYKEAEAQLMETLGAGGGLGSARGGFSGQGAAGLGKYWADVAPEYTQSLWGMTAPALQAGWGAELSRSRDIWGQEQAAKQFPFQVIPSMFGQSMPTPVVSQGGGKK